jgi:hypothetical protein
MSVQVPYPAIRTPVINAKQYYYTTMTGDFKNLGSFLKQYNCKRIFGDTPATGDVYANDVYEFNTGEDLTFFILRWS